MTKKIIILIAVVITGILFVTCNKEVNVKSLELNHSTLLLGIGQSENLKVVKILPDNATDKSYSWTNSDPSVAIFSDETVTALSVGTTTITATATVGGSTATCKVTVTELGVPVTSISLDKTNLTLDIGQSYTLSATVKPDNATNKTVIWTSSNTSKVTVDYYSGKVTAKNAGEAIITAKASDKTATCTVKVPEIAVQSITLDKTTLDLFISDYGAYLQATVKPDNATNKTVTWTSSNSAVADVSGTSDRTYVTVKGKGSAIITAKAGDKTATCTVNVLEIKLDKQEIELVVGEACTLNATTNPAGQPILWTSTNTSIASVEGMYSQGKVIVKSSGTVSINATYNGQTTSCNLTIYDVPLSGVTIEGVTWAAVNINTPGTFAGQITDRGKCYQWNSKIPYDECGTMSTFPEGTA